jgi:hypothetical protein
MKIRENVSANTSDRWVRKVIQYDNAARVQEFVDQEEINEHVIKGARAVYEGEINRHMFLS